MMLLGWHVHSSVPRTVPRDHDFPVDIDVEDEGGFPWEAPSELEILLPKKDLLRAQRLLTRQVRSRKSA